MGMARLVAAVFGAVYIAAGLAGFILETPLFGLFDVNPLHNIVHIVIGAVLMVYNLWRTIRGDEPVDAAEQPRIAAAPELRPVAAE